jgi:hypothetical protein
VKINLAPIIGVLITLAAGAVGWYGLYRVALLARQILGW